MGFFRVIIYGIMFGVYAGSLYYDVQYMPRPGFDSWFSKLVMLTMLNFVLQTVYHTICFICTLIDWKEEMTHVKTYDAKHSHVPSYWRSTKFHAVVDVMYATSAFPVGMATCLLFWGLYLANPEFVVPREVAKIIPQWHNHVTHTAPIGFLLIDTIVTCHRTPPKRYGGIVVASLYLLYLTIIFSVRYVHGFWLYPLFNYLDDVYIAAFLAGGGLGLWILYLIGDGFNRLLWGSAHAETAPIAVGKQTQKTD